MGGGGGRLAGKPIRIAGKIVLLHPTHLSLVPTKRPETLLAACQTYNINISSWSDIVVLLFINIDICIYLLLYIAGRYFTKDNFTIV